MQNFDLSQKIGKAVTKTGNLLHFSGSSLLYFKFEPVLKALELPKLSKKVSLNRSRASWIFLKKIQRQSFTKYLRLTLVFM